MMMELGMIGLGKMGANMTTRLGKGGHKVVVFDRSPEAVTKAASGGAQANKSLEELVQKLSDPRTVCVMIPSGQPTEDTVNALSGLLQKGDTVIDGGNSNYKDSVRRGATLAAEGLNFIDVGTSGGIWGLSEGYSL